MLQMKKRQRKFKNPSLTELKKRYGGGGYEHVLCHPVGGWVWQGVKTRSAPP